MGKGSGGGTNTVVQNSGPPGEVLQNYQDIYHQAQNVASQPTSAYNGALLAGFSPMQTAAFNNINTAVNAAQPYLNQAYQNSLASTTALDPAHFGATQGFYSNTGINPYLDVAGGEINSAEHLSQGVASGLSAPNFGSTIGSYYNPFAQSVIAPTQALFNEQNQEALNNVRGNAVSQGAFGGDREAIAEAQTMQNQTLAQAPVLANLQNQGYQQAVQNAMQSAGLGQQAAGLTLQGAGARTGLANLQQNSFNAATSAAQGNAWLQSQGAFGMGNLGQEVQSLGLQGAGAQLNAGSLQQALAQQELSVPYQQYQAAQGYPYQITNWLNGIGTGTGSLSGTHGSTTSPGPSGLSQVAGLGLTGAGLLGQSGAFGASGWLTGAGAQAGIDAGTWDAVGAGAGSAAMEAALASGAIDAGVWDAAPAAAALAFAKRGGRIAGLADGGEVDWQDPGLTTSLGGVGAISGLGYTRERPGIAGMGYDIGGASPAMTASFGGNPMMSGAMQQYADLPEEKLQELAVRFPPNSSQGAMVHRALMARRMNPGVQGYADGGMTMNDDAFVAAEDQPTVDPYVAAASDDAPAPFIIPSTAKPALPSAPVVPVRSDIVVPQQQTLGDAPLHDDADTGGLDSGSFDDTADGSSAPASNAGHGPWGTILAAGLGMLSGTSPFAGVNIGKGGLEGLNYATQQKKLDEQTALRRATIDSNNIYRQAMMGYRGDRLTLDTNKAASLDKFRTLMTQFQADGMDETKAHHRAMELLGLTNADIHQDSVNSTKDYHGRLLEQGDQRIQQRAAQIANSTEAAQAKLDMQRQGMDAARISNIMNNATRMVAADITGHMTLAEAVRQQMGQRGSMGGGNAAPPAGGVPMTAVNPQTGQRVRRQPDGSWAPIS